MSKGCNCGSSKPKPRPGGKEQSFVLTGTNGRTQSFGSRLEAQAANVRLYGGQGNVKP